MDFEISSYKATLNNPRASLEENSQNLWDDYISNKEVLVRANVEDIKFIVITIDMVPL